MDKLVNHMNKKLLFSLLIVVGLFVAMFGFLVIYKSITERNVSHAKLEDMMVKSAVRYFESNELPAVDGEFKTVTIETLVSDGYLKSLDKITEDTTCSGKVVVRNNGGNFLYIPSLSCSEYKTKTLADAVKVNLVTTESGLYEIDGEYVFKGEDVHNYVSFADTTWRIVKIDKNGLIKLIKVEEEKDPIIWDDRYNSEAKYTAGINDYKISRIKDKLNDIYNNPKIFSSSDKKHIVSADVCVGRRSESNKSLKENDLCNEILENQFVSLLNVTDVANASIDTGCQTLADRVCQNYNFFGEFFTTSWTLTGNLDNTYEVYVTSNGYSYINNASDYDSYFIVTHIDSSEKYISGLGSKEDPLVIN